MEIVKQVYGELEMRMAIGKQVYGDVKQVYGELEMRMAI